MQTNSYTTLLSSGCVNEQSILINPLQMKQIQQFRLSQGRVFI